MKNWKNIFSSPLQGRGEKPRRNGLTMVLDKGLSIWSLASLLKVSAQYIDYIKLSFGSALLYPSDILEKKIKIITNHGIMVYPGGTLFEIAVRQNIVKKYLYRIKKLGFNAVEISNGTISLSLKTRNSIINKARSVGLKVITEVGKKDPEQMLEIGETIKLVQNDIEQGSELIIIEGRESGKGISIYKKDGMVDEQKVAYILEEVPSPQKIMWETPLKKQQVYFIEKLGPNVNLGNICSEDILAVECLRRGLRGDTFKETLNTKEAKKDRLKI